VPERDTEPANSGTISRDGDRAEALNGRREKRKKRLHKPFTPLVTVAYTSNEETLHTRLEYRVLDCPQSQSQLEKSNALWVAPADP
jgi:hypothetical protein